jgi:hypothetical protein
VKRDGCGWVVVGWVAGGCLGGSSCFCDVVGWGDLVSCASLRAGGWGGSLWGGTDFLGDIGPSLGAPSLGDTVPSLGEVGPASLGETTASLGETGASLGASLGETTAGSCCCGEASLGETLSCVAGLCGWDMRRGPGCLGCSVWRVGFDWTSRGRCSSLEEAEVCCTTTLFVAVSSMRNFGTGCPGDVTITVVACAGGWGGWTDGWDMRRAPAAVGGLDVDDDGGRGCEFPSFAFTPSTSAATTTPNPSFFGSSAPSGSLSLFGPVFSVVVMVVGVVVVVVAAWWEWW